jgi:hypothetical protein
MVYNMKKNIDSYINYIIRTTNTYFNKFLFSFFFIRYSNIIQIYSRKKLKLPVYIQIICDQTRSKIS